MQILFWLLLLGFAALVVGGVVAVRRIGRADKALDEAAITAYRVEHGLPLADVDPPSDDEDLDAKWAEFWQERDLEFRGTPLWASLHDPSDSWVRGTAGWHSGLGPDEWADQLIDDEHLTLVTEWETARLDKVKRETSLTAARAADRLVRRSKAGFVGVVDMTAQWIHARRRSVKRMNAVLNKTDTWPDEWKRQLKVMLDQGAVARARGQVTVR